MRVVVALGGNALLPRGRPMTPANQVEAVAGAMDVLAPVSQEHQLVITHGNGPQVGLLANLTATAGADTAEPFDVLDAQTEGMIGYLIERELREQLPAVRQVATLVTLVEVDPKDPAFANPTKFIGPVYSESDAKKMALQREWTVKPDGEYWRRVVPSPKPLAIPVVHTIDLLVDNGITVVCAGGGGVPVSWDPHKKEYTGIEGVIDKDLASSLLAREIGADMLIMATDVDAVYEGWGTDDQKAVATTSPDVIGKSEFAAGSMGPKVTAAVEFATGSKGDAIIGSLYNLGDILDGKSGTSVSRRHSGITYY